KAFDQYGNLAPGYAGQIHFVSTDSAAILPANAGLIAGQGVFPVTLRTAGSHTVTATDTLSAAPLSLTGASSVITTRGLTVTLFVPTSTGFTLTFSKPLDPA